MNATIDDHITWRVQISGRVQGVWFRAWTCEQALQRDLNGWVRNRLDGSVEAVFSGPENLVQEMIEACRAGPPLAKVSDLQVQELSGPDNKPDPGFISMETA